MHYGSHLLDAFIGWVNDGFPVNATVKTYEGTVHEVTLLDWRRFMRRMEFSSDVIPNSTREDLESRFPEIFDQGGAYSYGRVAQWLLEHYAPVEGVKD